MEIVPQTRDAVINIALLQLGVTENPPNSNRQKYGEAYGMNGVPWCMIFVWWVFKQAGFNLRKTPSCTQLTNAYKAAGQWVTENFKPGDIAMFDFSGKKKTTVHTGVVYQVFADHIVTIEGNTSCGNDANGGCVMLRQRPLNVVTGACRPNYNM